MIVFHQYQAKVVVCFDKGIIIQSLECSRQDNKIISTMPLYQLSELRQHKSGFLFDGLYHWSHGPWREEVP